jgi:O-acetyl-ADP-ribose deacetylase (regulator of RNase III)
MTCKKCSYSRFIADHCARCFENYFGRNLSSYHLEDFYVPSIIGKTKIFIFPTVFGGDKSIAHWLTDKKTGDKNNISYLLNISNTRFGQSIDAVVNSSNNFLIPGSGLARFLHENLDDDYRAKTRFLANQNLELGKSYFIPIDKNFRINKGIIESISICYTKNQNEQLNIVPSSSRDIYNCVYSILALCDKIGLKSVAIPQMASRAGYSIYKTGASKAMITAALMAIQDYLFQYESQIEQIFYHPSSLEDEEMAVWLLRRY